MYYSNQPISVLFDLPKIPKKATVKVFNDDDSVFIPAANDHYVFVQSVVRDILAFIQRPYGDAMYITGPTGCGKTSSVCEIAAKLNYPVQQVTASGQLEANDLIGHFTLSSENVGDVPTMRFIDGVLTTAMRLGHILLINEIDLVDPSELSALNDVLDGRPLVISQNGGEIVKPHPAFRVIVTGNSNGQGDRSGMYQGVMVQNIAAMDRYRMIEVNYPEKETETEIIKKVASPLPETIISSMVDVANKIRNLFQGDDDQAGQINVTMSTRTLLRWAKLTLQFKGAPNALEFALSQALLLRTSPEEREAILRITKDVFGDQWA